MTTTASRRVRTAYDTVAANYAQLLPDPSAEADIDRAMLAHFVQGLARDAEVLDVGCGTGRMIPLLHDGGRRVIGLDQSPGMLAQARARHSDIVLAAGELASLPFPDERFDGVLAWYSIIHTPPHELGRAFAEFHRVLRRGGTVLLGYQAGTGHRHIAHAYGHDLDLPAFLHHTPYIEASLAAAGLTVTARLDRVAAGREKNAQGLVLARRD